MTPRSSEWVAEVNAMCRDSGEVVADFGRIVAHTSRPLAAVEVTISSDGELRRAVHVLDMSNGKARVHPLEIRDPDAMCWHDAAAELFVAARDSTGCSVVERWAVLEPGRRERLQRFDGVIEALTNGPTGLLVLEAQTGAQLSDVRGSGTIDGPANMPNWFPRVLPGSGGRRVLTEVEHETGDRSEMSDLNVWEFAVAPDGTAYVLASEDPTESGWFDATLTRVARDRAPVLLHESPAQMAQPRTSPSGARWSILQGPASDRGLLAGDLVVDGHTVATDDIHVCDHVWTSESTILLTGMRGLTTVIASVDPADGLVTPIWESASLTNGGALQPTSTVMSKQQVLAVLEGHDIPPAVFSIGQGREPVRILSSDSPGKRVATRIGGSTSAVRWNSTDGVEIEGLLTIPAGSEAKALIVMAHGGPMGMHRPTWGPRDPYTSVLAARGFAVLRPNPRGSLGRGNWFAGQVSFDVGGMDAVDILTGIDHVKASLGDLPVGVTGNSYGGYLAAWLPTLSQIFYAAVCRSPVTDWQLLHLTTNLTALDVRLLDGDPLGPSSHYVSRSPVRAVARNHAPSLLTAGERDLATPPSQALAMHNALRQVGAESELVLYPEEGHGVRHPPAQQDQCARMIDWFEEHLHTC